MPSDDNNRIDCSNDFNYWGNYDHRCPDHYNQSTNYHYHPRSHHYDDQYNDNDYAPKPAVRRGPSGGGSESQHSS